MSKLNETSESKSLNRILFENKYLLKRINMQIVHNTSEIDEVRVELWYARSVKLADEKRRFSTTIPNEYWLYMDVKFVNKTFDNVPTINSNFIDSIKKKEDSQNQGSTIDTMASTPLGYLQGKPIIMAKILSQNLTNDDDGSTTTTSAAEGENNFQLEEIQIMGKSGGFCHRDGDKFSLERHQILYGINLVLNCKHRLRDSLQKGLQNVNNQPQNSTGYCQQIQNDIIEQLLGEKFNLTDAKYLRYYIAELAQPRSGNIHDWTPFRVENVDYEDFVMGQFNEATNTLICRNILLNVAYEFLSGNFQVDSLPHQQLIKNAVLRLGPQRHNIEFELNEIFEIPLTASIRFFNFKEFSLK